MIPGLNWVATKKRNRGNHMDYCHLPSYDFLKAYTRFSLFFIPREPILRVCLMSEISEQMNARLW